MLICRALIKYGYSNFRLEILEYCATEDLTARENYYINLFTPEYNIVQQSNTMPSRFGYSHSKSTIAKIAKAQPSRVTVSVKDLLTNTVKTYDSMAQANKNLNLPVGRVKNYLASVKQGKLLNNRYVITKLETTYVKPVKVVESWRIGKKIEVLDIDTHISTVYSSMRSAALAIGVQHSTIHKYLRLDVPYKDKYKFSYYNPSPSEED